MPLHSSIKDFNFITCLYKYLNIFLITSWYDFRKNSLCHKKLCKAYGCFLVAINIFGLLYVIMGSPSSVFFNKMFFTQKLIFFAIYGNSIFLTSFTVVKSCFWDGEKWATLIKNFQYVDEKLGNKNKRDTCIFKNFYWKCFIHHCLLFLVVGYQVYVWCRMVNVSLMKTVAISNLKDVYYEFLLIVLISGIVESFQARYEDLNAKLRCETRFKNFQNLSEAFRILSENVDIFNNLFGYQIAIIICHCGLELVSCLNIAFSAYVLVSGDMLRHILLASLSILLATTWHFLRIVLPIDSTVKEAKRFVYLSYTFQEKLLESKDIEDIVRITNCSRNYVPEFSAAGFFSVNKGLIFCVLGNVAAYFIIATQVNEAVVLKLRGPE